MKAGVIMPSYNNGRFIRQAIKSILAQSMDFNDYMLFIVDNNSNDDSPDIINEYTKLHNNVLMVNNKNRQGGQYTYNFGVDYVLKHYPGIEYITFQDADDYSSPKRLEKQIDFLDNNPEYGICGTRYVSVDEENEILGATELRLDDEELRAVGYFANPCCGASCMIRTGILRKAGNYDVRFKESWDWELITRVMRISKIANLPDYLYFYRRYHVNIDKSKQQKQVHYGDLIRYKLFCEDIGIDFNPDNHKTPYWQHRRENIK